MHRFFLGIVLSLSLCAERAFAQEWFDDYTRGVEALDRGKLDLAIRHLERAIRRRPDPGTNLITYGTNRLPEYFPYLKLGEAHLRAGRLEAARDAMRISESKNEPADAIAALLARIQAEARIRDEGERAARKEVVTEPRPPLPSHSTTTTSVVPAEPAPPPVPKTGKLVVRSAPSDGASVFAGDRFLGVTPLTVELEEGEYDIRLSKEGARPERLSVRIAAGETRTLTHRLSPVAPATAPAPRAAPPEPAFDPPSLLVISEPPGASVYLDDEPIGSTDPETGRLLRSNVTARTHRLRLSRTGHEDLVAEIEIGPKGETTYQGTLVSIPVPVASTASPSATIPAANAPGGGATPWLILPGFALAMVGIFVVLRRRSSHAEERTTTVAVTPVPRRGEVSPRKRSANAAAETRVAAGDAQGERFGEFRLLKRLGKGGMAEVFLAERGAKRFALKRPLAAILEDEEFRGRFLREAEIGRSLHHPNIIRIFDRGEVRGVPFFIMEVVEGETLSKKLMREEASEAKDAAAVVLQIAEALDYAHLKGVVHRDLKPSNIMILMDGTVKVMDYGIARARRFNGLTLTGEFLGTPNYAAPEAAEGKETDARSDLYSLGVIFYEMVTGKRPFISDNPLVTLKKHCSEPPTPPSVIAPEVPRRLEVMILRLLAKAPGDRYQDAEHLLVELRDFLNRDRGAS